MFWNFYRTFCDFLQDVQKWNFGAWMEGEKGGGMSMEVK